MRLLLDTQALIWHHEDNPALSRKAGDAIESSANEIIISVATIWEMSIKVALGKLTLDEPVAGIISRYKAEGAIILPISETHALGVGGLPHFHRDPFDRLLVSQAMCEDLSIVTVDEYIRQYPIKYIW